MILPPLIRTDTSRHLPSGGLRTLWVSPEPSRLRLFAAELQLDDSLLESLAIHIDALLLEVRDRLLGQVRAVGSPLGGLVDHLVRVRDLRRLRELLRIHDTDPELVRPDERVDLVHLPCLMAARQRGALADDDVRALL